MKLLSARLYLCFVFMLSSLSNGRAVVPVPRTITVDINGYGNFKTIQAAIDSVPSGNNVWTRIRINSGTYTEKVYLPADKGFLVFEGTDWASQTKIEWGAYAAPSSSSWLSSPPTTFRTPTRRPGSKTDSFGSLDDLFQTATFTIAASNVVFRNISFVNTYSESMTSPAREIAALIQGDKISFYGCSFIGVQDTLADFQGRHYFKDCYVEGAVDFIFGNGQSLYEDCSLFTVPSKASAGWVTAQGRSNAADPSGYVFKYCNLNGQARTLLGRAWGSYSRVIFYQTYMSNIVVPQGWSNWTDPYEGYYTTYVESGNTGEGSNTEGRVKWEKKMSDEDLAKFTNISFVDDGWLSQQGY